MSDKTLIEKAKTEEAMGHLGRITSLEDLPKDTLLVKYIREAMKLNEAGIKVPKARPAGEKKPLKVPAYFLEAVKKNKKALETFEKFSEGKRKDYVNWVEEAKTETTRNSRLKTSVQWLSEGKPRNWKYMK